MIVVSDTSPIRALAHLEQLQLLSRLFDQVLIPPAVADELERPKSTLPPLSLDPYRFVRVQSPVDQSLVIRLQHDLDAGESQAIALALEVGAELLLIDERAGRSIAAREGLLTMGAVGVLLRAKSAGLVPAIKPLIDRLESELHFFVARSLRDEALRSAGEHP